MQRKLRLQKADRYAFLVCAQMMSQMVVAYLEGRQAAKWLGCEQGAVPDWDDIVQELSDGTLRHTQVKRQATDFSNDKAKRDFKVQKTKKGGPATSGAASPELRDRSAFDESIAALANWFLPTTLTDGKVRIFTVQVPDRQVKIKHEFEMRNFEEFCALCNLSATTPAGLNAHAQMNPVAARIFDWLTTWCGFNDWEHIHKALRNLRVEIKALEPEIEQAAESILDRYFFPASEAFKVLVHDLEYGSTDAGAATPRQMLTLISRFLRAEVPIWTQYAFDDKSFSWGVSGFATGYSNGIEDPAQTVPIYWNDGTQSAKRLKICAKFDHQIFSRDPLAVRLMRLALHLRGPGHASMAELSPWSVAIKGALANTLGITSDDFFNLQWVEAKDVSYCVDSRQLPSVVDTNLECANFDTAMGKQVWELTKAEVSGLIRGMTGGDLQVRVDVLWRKIFPTLDADAQKVNALLGDMLNPSSEGLKALGIMRLGPRTVPLLSQGLVMMMVTAVALSRDSDITALLAAKEMRVIALRYWGGPASMHRIPRELVDDDDDSAIEDFMGKELSDIVLMPQVRAPHSVVNRETIATDLSSQDSFGAPRRAKLAVTNSRQFRDAVRSGEVAKVTALLASELQLRNSAREENIMKTELTK
nr:ABC-three component system protein [uncultured Massilia sp.]